ncbi:hypothetical protein [Chelatococcus asaccharovorans]|uniref:hypothetical protein n=1 Tax=Chelatococcus asaccharovorans TaxID=28210 RepID=UPI00224C6870|nr:hypothetical protein [Chelatococcus asaccharovorans]CAH1651378.1 conserved hypothetical protein [Chelatococcus asaccharovorans]CAH1686628.1 conserved hypothetical protein [Chelatococcus asaccharovorans]
MVPEGYMVGVKGNEDLNRVFARAMPIPRGLFALRYLGADDERNPPRVSVHVGPDVAGDVHLLFAPGAEDGIMRRPGDAVVVSSSGDAMIVVTIFVGEFALSDGVKLKIDQLDKVSGRDGELVRASSGHKKKSQDSSEEMPIYLSGHIQRRGDVSLPAGEWLGGRSSRQHIEGFAVHWPRRPMGVDIEYDCSVSGQGRMPEALTGGFIGTRARALSIDGVSLRLIGENAASYKLQAEAIFSDGTAVRSSSSELVAAPRDPGASLVGLTVHVQKAEIESVKASATQLSETSVGGSVDHQLADSVPEMKDAGARNGMGLRSERVRVFRGARSFANRHAAE